MAFLKVIKNKAYYKRYQVKYRRRREGKTDYRQRLRLTIQDKNKYNSPKYRFVVRVTATDVIVQVAYATIAGDKILAAAYSHELPSYGLKVGLTNYAACYCTGLLCARRLLTSLKSGGKTMAELYPGNDGDVGEDFNVEELDDEEAPRPFTALLDVGLARTSTGSKVFAAMKGGVDGGISIPHNEKRFAGSTAEDGADAEQLRHYIMGGHVSDYMEHLQEDDTAKYESQFARYIKAGVDGEGLEDLYESVHESIRKNPTHKKKDRKKPAKATIWKAKKHSYETRKANLKAKLEQLMA